MAVRSSAVKPNRALRRVCAPSTLGSMRSAAPAREGSSSCRGIPVSQINQMVQRGQTMELDVSLSGPSGSTAFCCTNPRSTRDRPEIDPRLPEIARDRPDSPPRYSTAGGLYPTGFLPSAGRDRPEIDPRPARAINPTFYAPKPPLWGTPPPSPRASVSFASRQWGLGGGCEKRTGEAGEGGVHSEDCRPRRGFLPQGFYPPREDRRGEGVGSNSPRNISPPQDPALPPSWSHHLDPQSWGHLASHPLLAQCPPLCVAVIRGTLSCAVIVRVGCLVFILLIAKNLS